MFKITAVVLAAAALISGAQSAAVDLDARQVRACPISTQLCGFFILGPQSGPCELLGFIVVFLYF
jgi:hypothetical protein